MQLKSGACPKIVEIPSFSPPPMAGGKILSTNWHHPPNLLKQWHCCFFPRRSLNYSCYDLKQFSKVNLSVYFLPAVGREKIIKIRHFSNETAIFLN
ncbi:MAG: hypothetical protein LBR79_06895 [Oscillospiraceae bacterium]|nr:hypothetical protein [Oscillospiraceae bacterium]